MTNFFEKEVDKIEKKWENHQKKKDKEDLKSEGAPFYKNINTGAIISSEEYMNMAYEQELELNNIMQPDLNGINNISALMDEDVVNSEYGTYVPYYPNDKDKKND